MIQSRMALSGMFKSSVMTSSQFRAVPAMSSSFLPQERPAASRVAFPPVFVQSQSLDSERVKAVGRYFYQIYGGKAAGGLHNAVQQIQIDAYKTKTVEQSQSTVDQLARIMDVDGDGVISEADCQALALRYLCGLTQRPRAAPVYTKQVQERLDVARRLFKKFDQDGSGFLTEDQVPMLLEDTYRIMGNNTFKASREDVRSWMQMTNKSRTGKVTLEEYEESIIISLRNAGIKIYDQ